ncbi:hypothetical protein CKO42_17695 [Lamprobacter modestohalophilus]|uniref:DUF3150 domain-containing protein n=1 Tax=Lamprobacter modestohalophilus TaxID=1064514 RepID=A0A9X0WB61_9GAMM|nr:DUF3150 domain-containing protein [Lamprobacter modestohalophilus]MBK1620241.1 hypothetical protein [Lamprobacter modestohalophilus]
MNTTSIPAPAPEVLRLTDQTTLFLIDYHIWSGRKKLRPEDLRMGQDRPPDELISLGSKKVCDPQALRVFHRKRRQVERELLAVGTRFLGGYLVPNSHAAAVLVEANRLTGEARAAAEAFLADYDRHIDAWCAAYPRWEPAILKAIDPVEVVRAQLRFRVQALRIETSLAVAEDTLAEDLEAVGETIFSEVERMARHLEQSFLGKDELSQRVLGTFRRIADKLDALSFADYRIDPVVRSLRAWLARLPATGSITGGLFLEGWALMRLVGDAEAMARHGAGLLALAELMPRDAIGQALAGRSDDTVDADETAGSADADADADADSDAVSGMDAQTDSDAFAPVSNDTQTKPAEASSTRAEPIADFDALFNDDPVDGQDASQEIESTNASPALVPSTTPEPISAQDFWF